MATKKKSATKKPATKKKPVAQKKAAIKKVTNKSKTTKSAKSKSKPPTKKKAVVPKKKTKAPKKSAKTASKPKPKPKPRPKSSAKILPKKFLMDLAQAIKVAVLPEMASTKGRAIVGSAQSGDATFHIDAVAEKALKNFLTNAKQPVVYYSEDAGYTTFTNEQPTHLLLIDPIDGTRAAKCGFEGCVISVCSTRVIERPTFADIDSGLIMELTEDRFFYAERGHGARIHYNGHSKKAKISQNEDVETMAWSMTVPARPAELIFPTSAKLIDITSLKGGFFACNSSSYSLTRLVTNQLDACVDIANRFYRDIPDAVEDAFINAGRGTVLGVCPYDYAAALLIAQEAGCVVTDAYGKGFDDLLLLDSSPENHQTIIAATNAKLHKKLLSYYDTRITQLAQLLQERYEATGA
ncbi:MAG: inositol monophosphatase family protein [Candidatus Hydrogenedentota bacterium]